MARGGKRAGAGRKIGATNVRTRQIANKACLEGVTPLEVMLEAMRASYSEGDVDKAVGYAALAAPYLHPKLASTQVAIKEDLQDLVRRLQEGRARANQAQAAQKIDNI